MRAFCVLFFGLVVGLAAHGQEVIDREREFSLVVHPISRVTGRAPVHPKSQIPDKGLLRAVVTWKEVEPNRFVCSGGELAFGKSFPCRLTPRAAIRFLDLVEFWAFGRTQPKGLTVTDKPPILHRPTLRAESPSNPERFLLPRLTALAEKVALESALIHAFHVDSAGEFMLVWREDGRDYVLGSRAWIQGAVEATEPPTGGVVHFTYRTPVLKKADEGLPSGSARADARVLGIGEGGVVVEAAGSVLGLLEKETPKGAGRVPTLRTWRMRQGRGDIGETWYVLTQARVPRGNLVFGCMCLSQRGWRHQGLVVDPEVLAGEWGEYR